MMNNLIPNLLDTNCLYSLVESYRYSMLPFRFGITNMSDMLEKSQFHNVHLTSTLKASIDLAERLTRIYQKPEFNITQCSVDDKLQIVRQKTITKDNFCHLQHFEKPNCKTKQPKLLIVAPMSGHHATLLRGTVEDTLPFFDVYITDWIDASQVPIADGSFDLDSFIDYVINYLKLLGPDVHVHAVCQPTVPVLAAAAIMSADKDPHIPKSIILVGGPIDARKNPTKPNDFAIDKNLEWFDQSLITSVPSNYPGHRRRVYPGFLQLMGFIAMNPEKHLNAHIELFQNIVVNDTSKITKHKKFYDEYLSVMNLTAEFYLQTIKEVFHDFSLAKGKFVSRGRKVDLKAITKCALLGIEGGKDDIAAVGQTKAALNLCKNIPESKRHYHLHPEVGHYGLFSGSKFKNIIVPKMKEFIYAHN